MTPQEPQSAAHYDDRTTAAVKSVLIEIGQILGSFKGKFAVIGGAVPWLLLDNDEMHHVGTIDIDLSLDAEALADTAYVALIDALMGNGYEQRETLRRFQLVRNVTTTDGGPSINVIVDFLMPRHAEIEKRIPPLLGNFAVQRADGADLATRFYQMTAISGPMPNGGMNTVEVAVCSIPALLAMKGYALNGRLKQKDAYDVYFCIRNYPNGIDGLAQACRPLLDSTAAPPDSATLRKSSTRQMASALLQCDASSRTHAYSEIERRTNGSRMRSDKSTHCCMSSGCDGNRRQHATAHGPISTLFECAAVARALVNVLVASLLEPPTFKDVRP